ncbi:MAG: hypothetical protein A2W34_03930 [Chloroflexi bacterium RBG_16_64_32]|nr:MAG: hypothetical protein A2W34_03930 [Chloroflexi bacterium RBG_16_64_32]
MSPEQHRPPAFPTAPTLAVAIANADHHAAALVLLTAAAETITADKEAQRQSAEGGRHRQPQQATQATARRPARQH